MKEIQGTWYAVNLTCSGSALLLCCCEDNTEAVFHVQGVRVMTYCPVLYRVHIFKTNGLLLHRMLLTACNVISECNYYRQHFHLAKTTCKEVTKRYRRCHSAKGKERREWGNKTEQFSSLWLNKQWMLLHTFRQIQSACCMLSEPLFYWVQAFAKIICCIALLLGFVCFFSRCLRFLWIAALSTCFC